MASTPLVASRTVLLVEDDEIDRERVWRWLNKHERGWRVLTATTLAEAMEHLRSEHPEVAIVDLRLPDASGLQAARQIAEGAPGCAVIVLSGVDDEATAMAALGYGAQDYLNKDELSEDLLARSIRYAITREQTRQRLDEVSAELAETDSELDDFAHVLAHDLRAPVRTARLIGNRLDALITTEDPLIVELASRLDASLARLDSIILSLLDYSSLRGQAVELSPVPLRALIAEAADAVAADLEEVGGRVDVAIDLDATIHGSADLLWRVIENLLTNCIRYRRPEVPLSVEITAERGEHSVVVRVSDNGIGVPASEAERVFGVLERLDTSLPGSGFGLAICRRVMSTMSGEIWIDTEYAAGTSVLIKLPAIAPATSDHDLGRDLAGDLGRDSDGLVGVVPHRD